MHDIKYIRDNFETFKKKIYKSGLRITKSSNYWLTYPIPFSNIPKFIRNIFKSDNDKILPINTAVEK